MLTSAERMALKHFYIEEVVGGLKGIEQERKAKAIGDKIITLNDQSRIIVYKNFYSNFISIYEIEVYSCE